MRCAVSIATHDRLDELQRTLAHVVKLQPGPDEIVVCADGCSDGTVAWLQAEYPQVRLFVNAKAVNSIRARDSIMRAVRSEIVLSLDDDSYPMETDALEKIKAEFQSNPELAVASFPQVTEEFPETLEGEVDRRSGNVGTYVNAAAAFRVSVYLELGGFDLDFEHMGDETDFSLRCIAAGYEIRRAGHITIRHHWSGTGRNEMRNHHRHARNEQWSIWKLCPFPWIVGVSLFRAVRQAQYAAKRGLRWLVREPDWWSAALSKLAARWKLRKTVPWKTYWQWMRLIRSGVKNQ